MATTRFSRPAIAVVAVFIVFVLYATHATYTRDSSLFYHDSSLQVPGALEAWIEDEDRRYSETVQARKEMIIKNGPRPSAVDAFPMNGMYTLCALRPMLYVIARIASSALADSAMVFGPEIENVTTLKQRAHFQPWALGGEDRHSEYDNPKVYTLQTLMAMNGHDFIDILKIDIEGAEFESLNELLRAYTPSAYGAPAPPLPFGQMQIEIHARDHQGDFAKFSQWWESLENAGLRPFWTEPNLVYINLIRGARPDLAEYSFLNIRGNHSIISDNFN
ncbi:hypothetical protein EWM64_g1218 [Hericium alpestre]|uniref:Methyltransferase FkbM domain-containing protein n=1 Tax=Hericium alpestre TaxID=135208 RepID=A0A4Z0A8X6_9AGAM|nr:hypothetical protein EWM64_g1218 [Hericium alpestre]